MMKGRWKMVSNNSYRENVFSWFNRDQRITFQLNQLKLKNQIKKLIEEGDTEIQITEEASDGSISGSMPLSYLKVSKPHKRNLTTEQRKAVAHRFKKAKEMELEKLKNEDNLK